MACLKMMFIILVLIMKQTLAFWDEGTTTEMPTREDTIPRQSFFRWQQVEYWNAFNHFWYYDWDEIGRRRVLCVVAGLSHDHLPITTGTLLNRRSLITASNPMEPFMDRQTEVRIWTLGNSGSNIAPFRYRVWRMKRVLPRSNNPEHWHGIRGIHQPRHDITCIMSKDHIYMPFSWPTKGSYAFRAHMYRDKLDKEMFFAGSGFEYLKHIAENYKIFHAPTSSDDLVDCSHYLPKWWGKFICLRNIKSFPGLQSGSGLFNFGQPPKLLGIGCFEIRYNEDRILVFTDLRYYIDIITILVDIYPIDYYEYAYPEYSGYYSGLGELFDPVINTPTIMKVHQVADMFPLG